jgi:hypothetical protein
MPSGPDISALYLEFTDALTEVLAENSAGLARRGRRVNVMANMDLTLKGTRILEN